MEKSKEVVEIEKLDAEIIALENASTKLYQKYIMNLNKENRQNWERIIDEVNKKRMELQKMAVVSNVDKRNIRTLV
jgi:hypothetical protein